MARFGFDELGTLNFSIGALEEAGTQHFGFVRVIPPKTGQKHPGWVQHTCKRLERCSLPIVCMTCCGRTKWSTMVTVFHTPARTKHGMFTSPNERCSSIPVGLHQSVQVVFIQIQGTLYQSMGCSSTACKSAAFDSHRLLTSTSYHRSGSSYCARKNMP